MSGSAAQYDHIGSQYDDYARTATMKRAERYTVFRMVAALDGERVLDLACGVGFYTRLLKQRGAAQVIGVDISPEMIRLAQQQEQAVPLGVTYQVGDAVVLPRLGSFDLVTAGLSAPLCDQQGTHCWVCSGASTTTWWTGGRFITYTDTPEFTINKSNCTPVWYHHICARTPRKTDMPARQSLSLSLRLRVSWYQWSQATYEWALKEAGFRDFIWYASEVAPEDIAHYGEAYWHDFYENCPIIGLICQEVERCAMTWRWVPGGKRA